MKKQTRQAWKQALYVVFGLIILFVVISYVASPTEEQDWSESVLQYQPLVEKYAEENEIAGYVDILLAIMMQESGGRGNDPMQASESLCGSIGCIDNPELSIKQGVSYFAETLKASDYDIELAIQSYNFGKGFISYVKTHSGQYSLETAIAFSREMYENAPDQSIYSCLRKEAKQYNACYGDIYYVQSVMGYAERLEEPQ
ncbi:lysozyme family protein [Ornithinibacillus scapharcae]|uniref:lysozyme family protein n=1 Tax=Ornithinibacillus scapharcae TaxID=1147159 RepID=UPI000225B10E|nr:lysozyme family protein [Ornithinibacillus scapharcae]